MKKKTPKGELLEWVKKSAKAGSVPAMRLLKEMVDEGWTNPTQLKQRRPAAVVTSRPEPQVKLGKKEAADQEAHDAHKGTPWADILN